jgi:aryl-alcohol dehydrogenase-like predicted oxidoreductase
MKSRNGNPEEKSGVSRRDFVRTGGAVLAGGAALGGGVVPARGDTSPGSRARLFPEAKGQEAKIKAYRTLGRTGFQVSDVGMGSVPLRETAVVRYAYDKGVNYFDTAEGYGNGAAERAIGDAMQHMDRDKIFIATKARIREGDDAEAVVQKVRQSLERLQTEYVDAYSMHAASTVEALDHPGFHEAMDLLKAEGRVRFRGVSYHGPGRDTDQPTVDVLSAAAEDGRFDMMLLVYNFMNHEDGDRILAACKANNVGTTAMKTSPGSIRYEPVDPENLTESQERYLQRFIRSGTFSGSFSADKRGRRPWSASMPRRSARKTCTTGPVPLPKGMVSRRPNNSGWGASIGSFKTPTCTRPVWPSRTSGWWTG